MSELPLEFRFNPMSQYRRGSINRTLTGYWTFEIEAEFSLILYVPDGQSRNTSARAAEHGVAAGRVCDGCRFVVLA